MIQAHAENGSYVVVGELVIHMLALSASADEPIGSEQAQPLGHCRHFFVQLFCELGDAMLSSHEQFEQAQATFVACAAEQCRRPLDDCRRAGLMLVRLVAARIIRRRTMAFGQTTSTRPWSSQ